MSSEANKGCPVFGCDNTQDNKSPKKCYAIIQLNRDLEFNQKKLPYAMNRTSAQGFANRCVDCLNKTKLQELVNKFNP